MQSNSLIIESVNNRQREGMKFIFDNYYKRLIIYAFRILGASNIHEAEDVAIESIEKAVLKNKRFETIVHFERFIFGITRNACLAILLHRKAVRRHLNSLSPDYYDGNEVQQKLNDEQNIKNLYSGIKTLPPMRRTVLQMIYVQGIKPLDVAKKLSLASDTIYSHKTIGEKTLRQQVKKII